MSDDRIDPADDQLDRETVEQTTKNLALLEQFIEEALREPALFDAIPDGATVVLLPTDDPDLAQRNLRLMADQQAKGKNVVLQRVGVAPPEPATSQSRILADD